MNQIKHFLGLFEKRPFETLATYFFEINMYSVKELPSDLFAEAWPVFLCCVNKLQLRHRRDEYPHMPH
jgi:hypothetical protein